MDSIVSNINVRSGLAAGVLFVSGAVCPAESQQLRIQLNFDQEFDQIKPTPSLITQYVSVNASMNLKGNIQSKENSNFVGGRHHGKHESVHTEEKTTRLGSSSAEEWRVAGQDKLINIVDYPSFKRAILLTVNGASCSAQVDYELKPSFTDYQFIRANGTLAVAQSATARRLSCSVTQE
ncbi:hypothetical protein [Roseiarcus sp.]|uniref:hypothetical protein n=1 Tax=Roseiarcus sp. TaxID=1969460 RepID=UPI003F9B05B2